MKAKLNKENNKRAGRYKGGEEGVSGSVCVVGGGVQSKTWEIIKRNENGLGGGVATDGGD